MSDQRFHEAFVAALEESASEVELRLHLHVPKAYQIEFHGLGKAGDSISLGEAEGMLYLGSDRYFKMIDVGIRVITKTTSVVFVRPSGHAPVPWTDTWNPDQFGPFKLLEFEVAIEP